MSAKLVSDSASPERLAAEARLAAHLDQLRSGAPGARLSAAERRHIGGARHYDEIEEIGPPRHGAPDLVDFADGFRAGYNAKSEHRAVLGSPAYRLGHAEGVHAAAGRRARAARCDRRQNWLKATLMATAAILLGLGLGAAARADTLSDWQQLNELCQGGSGATAGKACAQRQKAATRLRAEGWYQGAHGVWVAPAQVATFYRIVRHYDAAARANVGMLDKVMEGMMTELRAAVPPEAIFALWNGSAGELLATTPYAAALLMHGLPYLERTLSGHNDPRFVMVLRP